MINFSLNEVEAQALQQLIGERIGKKDYPIISDEDAVPLLELAVYLERCGVWWTDEGADVYVWYNTTELAETYRITADELAETHARPVSPVFTVEEEAFNWVKEIKPITELWLWAHWGRGWMGPGLRWDPAIGELEETK